MDTAQRQAHSFPEYADERDKATFVSGYSRLNPGLQETLLKFAFDHVPPECRDVLLLVIDASLPEDSGAN